MKKAGEMSQLKAPTSIFNFVFNLRWRINPSLLNPTASAFTPGTQTSASKHLKSAGEVHREN